MGISLRFKRQPFPLNCTRIFKQSSGGYTVDNTRFSELQIRFGYEADFFSMKKKEKHGTDEQKQRQKTASYHCD